MAVTKRALGVVRLSELSDDTTSPARQREIIGKAADLRGSTIVDWATDLDVSASKVHPFKRPELGDWLKRPDEYDELIFWRVDRFVRKMFPDFADMIAWAQQHGKGLVSATEAFDLQTPLGRAVAGLIASFAEMESDATRERVSGAHAYLRQNRRWGNGKPPYGYRVVKNPEGKGYVLAVDPESSTVVKELVRLVLNGVAPNALAIDLNQAGILTPNDYWRASTGKQPVRGTGWGRTSVMKILRNQAMLGYVQHNGKTVVGEDGMPLVRAEPLIGQVEWDRLQATLDARTTTKQRTYGASLLLDVAFCHCGQKLYRWTKTQSGRVYSYYLCATRNRRDKYVNVCPVKSIRADELENWVTDAWLRLAGSWEHLEKVYLPGDDPSEDVAQIRRALETVRVEHDTGGYDYPGGEAEYLARVQRLSGMLRELSQRPSRPAGFQYRPTGKTYRQLWEASDAAGRHSLMVHSGLRVIVAGEPWTAEQRRELAPGAPAVATNGRMALIVERGEIEIRSEP